MFSDIEKENEEGIAQNENDNANADSNNSEANDLLLASQATSSRLSSVENLSLFLDDHKYGRRSKEGTIKIIVEALNESIDNILKKRHATFIDKAVTDVDQRDEEELIQSENTKFMKVPAMAFLDIPLKPTIVQLLLREIVLLHNLFLKKNLMQYENWKGKVSNSISIPVCSNKNLSFG